MRSIGTRLEALEKRTTGTVPIHRMIIGETEQEARSRIGLAPGLDVFVVQRVIVGAGAGHANH